MRSPAAQCRLVPPCVEGYEPCSVLGASQIFFEVPVVMSAVQIAQGLCRRCSNESGAPPTPGVRTNTICFPSRDQRGELSREKSGAIHCTGLPSPANTPINA